MMRLFGRNKMYQLQDSLKTITEESVLLLKVGPLTEDHPPPTTQPIIPTPQKGGCWAIRQLWKKKKGRYNVTIPLITKEEDVVLLSVIPITEDRPPEDTAPPRSEGRANGRGEEEAEHEVIGEISSASSSIEEETISSVSSIIEEEETISSVSSSIEEEEETISSVSSSIEEEETISSVSSSIEEEETISWASSSIEEEETISWVSSSIEEEETISWVSSSIEEETISLASSSIEEEETISWVSSSIEEEETISWVSSSKEEEETISWVSSSIEEEETISWVSSSTEDRTWMVALEDFTIHKPIGKGSFGKVVLASHPSNQQKVAIKIIELGICESADHNEECNILEECKKIPYITRLFATFQKEAHLFLVMEFLSGGTLWELMEASAPLEDNIIRCLTAEIICGLQFIHARGIVHRDLKPANLLLDSDGHIKICDFGLSVAGVTGNVRIRGYAGTHTYMAPEVINGQPYRTTVDYYSLGVIVNEMSINIDQIRQIMAIRKTTPGFPVNWNRPIDRDVHLEDLITMLVLEDQDERARLVRDIRQHPFFKTTDWAEVEKGKSPAAFTPQSILKQMEDLNMKIEEFLANEEQDIQKKYEKKGSSEEVCLSVWSEDCLSWAIDSESSIRDLESTIVKGGV